MTVLGEGLGSSPEAPDYRTKAEKQAGLTAEIARSLWSYSPSDGVITLVVRSARKPAGSRLGHQGDRYRHYRFNGHRLSEHRLAWLLHYGVFPVDQIDHINRDPSDNRIENLRAADRCENMWNRSAQGGRKAAIKGVTLFRQKYRARITVRGKLTVIGFFDDPHEAGQAYAEAAKALQGEFCPPDLVPSGHEGRKAEVSSNLSAMERDT